MVQWTISSVERREHERAATGGPAQIATARPRRCRARQQDRGAVLIKTNPPPKPSGFFAQKARWAGAGLD
jgi:hypothetical protein